MDAWERCIRSMNFEEADRVPIFDYLYHPKLIQTITGIFNEDPLKATMRALNVLGIDMTPSLAVLQEKKEHRSKEGFIYLREGYTGWIKSRPFKSVEDAIGWRPKVERKNDWADMFVKDFEEKQSKLLNQTVLIGSNQVGFIHLYHHLGMEIFSLMLYKYPREFESIWDCLLEDEYEVAKVFAEHNLAPALFICDDLGYKWGLFGHPPL